MISFLKESVDATPGMTCNTLEISLLPPGLLYISDALMTLRLKGLSIDFLNEVVVTSTTSRLNNPSIKGISSKVDFVEVTVS